MGGIVYLVRFDGKVLAAKSIELGQKQAQLVPMPAKRLHLEFNRSPSRDRLSGQDTLAVKTYVRPGRCRDRWG